MSASQSGTVRQTREERGRYPIIFNAVKKEGLRLDAEAMRYVQVQLNALQLTNEEHVRKWVAMIIANIDKQNLPTGTIVLNKATVAAAVEMAWAAQERGHDYRFMVLDAYSFPKLRYNTDRKTFYADDSPRLLLGDADAKAAYLRERFNRVRARVLRNKLFTPPVLANVTAANEVLQLIPIESLLGGGPGSKLVLGMLSMLPDGGWCLEDPNTVIPIKIGPTCEPTPGMFTDHCLVLAEGFMQDGVFNLTFMGMPLVEKRSTSLEILPKIDFFGGAPLPAEIARLRRVEDESDQALMVIVCDVWLDDPKVMANLATMFAGLSDPFPVAYVFMGNFTSTPYAAGQKGHQVIAGYFDALADLILSFDGLAEKTKFVFIPGSDDPGLGDCLPRPPLPTLLTRKLRQRLGANAIFTTNPCRIRYCTQELVFFREDLISKMRRHCVIAPRSHDAEVQHMHEHLVKTVCDQGYLCPLPLSVQPVFWSHAHALDIYPLPDVMFLGDRHDQYETAYGECRTYNPGSFPTDGGFLVYMPQTKTAESSRIDQAAAAATQRREKEEAERRRKREKQRRAKEKAAALAAVTAERERTARAEMRPPRIVEENGHAPRRRENGTGLRQAASGDEDDGEQRAGRHESSDDGSEEAALAGEEDTGAGVAADLEHMHGPSPVAADAGAPRRRRTASDESTEREQHEHEQGEEDDDDDVSPGKRLAQRPQRPQRQDADGATVIVHKLSTSRERRRHWRRGDRQ